MPELKFTSTDEAAQTSGVKMLVYGRSGVGKTMLCATAPSPIILSAEKGLLSLSKANQLRVFGVAINIPVILIENIDDLMEAYEQLTSFENDFETICIDSITDIAEQILSHAKATMKDPRQAYGEMQERIMITLKSFRDIPDKHVLFIAQQEEAKSNENTLFRPALPGAKLSPKVPYITDEVFHLDVGKTPEGVEYHYLQTKPDLQFDAKDRSGALDLIEEPNLTNIINKIRHG